MNTTNLFGRIINVLQIFSSEFDENWSNDNLNIVI